ncbi:SpoIIE family protein phosphatase [Streptomyces nigra]|uniref:SpoIIE family protein phosphatase n=1 Tax=Streptomyces nigra TaxID=1827580 RepID=UPI00363F5B9F
MEGPQGTESMRREAVAPAPAELSRALAALGAGAYVVDERGCIIAVNPEAERMLGRASGDLTGYDAHDLLHRDPHGHRLPHSRCSMRQAFHAGRTAQGAPEYFALPDGSVRAVAWLITPYESDGDAADWTLVIFHPQEAPAEPASPAETPAATLTDLERLALLAEATTQLTSTLDTEEMLRRLSHLVVPRLADWVVVDLISERDEVWRELVVHADGTTLKRHEDLEGPMPPVLAESQWPLSRALRGVASTITGPEQYHGTPDSGIAVEQRRLFDRTGMHSAAIAPIRGAREVLGALTMGRATEPVAFTAADLPLAEDIARRAGLALDNARLYQRQRKVAETMQNHLLPQMPGVPGLEMTARYLPAPDASQVGGDWYDAFPLSDGATALAIGDVVGHDLEAAAGMAQVRNMLRAYAWSQNEPPSRVVTRLDEAMEHITDVSMATMIFARVEPLDDGTWRLTWTNAGHPPPLLITRDGVGHFLEAGHGVALGTGLRRRRPDAQAVLEPGCTLVLYTDGLVEEHGKILDVGLDRLHRHAAASVHRPLSVLADQVLRRVRPADNDDDVALLALRVPA